MIGMAGMALLQGGMGAIGGLAKLISGAIQRRRANKMLNDPASQRPDYEIPDEIFDALGILQSNLFDQGLPGQNALENQLDTQTAGSMDAILRGGGSTAEALAALTSVDEASKMQRTNMLIEGEKQDLKDQDALAQYLSGTVARYKDRQWEYNEYKPWQERMKAIQGMFGAAQQNLTTGASELGEIGGSVAGFFTKKAMVDNFWDNMASQAFDESSKSAAGVAFGESVSGMLGKSFETSGNLFQDAWMESIPAYDQSSFDFNIFNSTEFNPGFGDMFGGM